MREDGEERFHGIKWRWRHLRHKRIRFDCQCDRRKAQDLPS
jgi:redox-regulated HSP33 family molecular chaperone